MGQPPPGLPGAQGVQDRIHHLTPLPARWPSSALGPRHERFETCPLGVTQVSGIPFSCLSAHASSLPNLRPYFQDTILHQKKWSARLAPSVRKDSPV